MKKFIQKFSKKTPEKAYAQAMALYGREDLSGAAKAFRELAVAGHAPAQLKLAQMFENGEGVAQDLVEATHWYKAAAKQKLTAAESRLGELLLVGVFPNAQAAAAAANAGAGTEAYANALQKMVADSGSVRQNPAEALRWNQLAAKGGDAGAEARLGYQYAVGLGTTVDLKQAETHFAAAAARDNAAGQLGLGMLYSKCYGGEADYEKAAHWFARAAAQGNATAKYCLAALSLFDHTAALPAEQLLQLLTEAAEAKHPAAMFHLGELYRIGRGVPVSLPDAETWLRRAAANGHVAANLSLVRLLLSLDPPDHDSAAALCRQAAEAGDGQAQLLLGQMYQSGTGVPKDGREAARWLSKAADQGVIVAYEKLGALYSEGTVLEQDFRAAADWFHRAAAEGSADALYHLGTLQFEGLGVTRDSRAAVEGYRQAADKGSGTAALGLGVMYASGNGVEQDYKKAAAAYQRAVELGVTEAKFNLAFLNLRGLGVPKNAEQGIALLEQAVEEKSLDAVWALHTLYAEGEYIDKDPAQSAKWLLRAAEMGNVQAASRLCAWLDEGHPHAPPADAVIALMQNCAERGDGTALHTLAKLYKDGRHVPTDAAVARKWLQKAAEAGNAQAQAELGDALLAGDGQPADPIAAARWYERASRNGHTGATLALTRLGMEINPDGLDYAKLFSRWLAAAKRGDVLAQRMVGEYYLKGIGTQKSVTDAMQWLEKASNQGNDAAMVMLGALCLSEYRIATGGCDPIKLFSDAAALGNSDAYLNLGLCFEQGISCEQSFAQALNMYRAGASLGSTGAAVACGNLLVKSTEKEKLQEALSFYAIAEEQGNADAARVIVDIHESGILGPVDRDLVNRLREKHGLGRVAQPQQSIGLATQVGVAGTAIAGSSQVPRGNSSADLWVSSYREAVRASVDGRFLESATICVDILETNKNNSYALEALSASLSQLGSTESGAELLSRAESLLPDSSELKGVRGIWLYQAKHYEEAEGALRGACSESSKNAQFYLALAKILEQKKEPSDAAAVLRLGVEKCPPNEFLWANLGRLLGAIEGSPEALTYIEKAIARNEKVAEFHLYLSWVLKQRGDLEGAARSLMRAVELDGTRVGWRRQLGQLYSETLSFEQAKSEFEKALSIDPEHLDTRIRLARICLELKKFDEVIRHLDAERPTVETPAIVDLLLSHAYERKGDLDSARSLVRNAYGKDPQNKDIIARMSRLEASR